MDNENPDASLNWITEDIAIGNYLAAQDKTLLQSTAIASMLCLDNALKGRNPAEWGVKAIEDVPLEDGPGNDPRLFRWAVDALARLVKEAAPVLIHCHAGRSRSAVVVAGYLMQSLGIGPEKALARVAAKREIAVTAGLERLLESLG
jgi:hypothetical protein